MARRVFTMLIVAFLILVIILLVLNQRKQIIDWSSSGTALASLIVAVLEVIAVIGVLYVFHQYLRSSRPRQFIFYGFANGSKVNVDLDINALSKEELVHQFQIIYYELSQFKEKVSQEQSDDEWEVTGENTDYYKSFSFDEICFENDPYKWNLAQFFPHDIEPKIIDFLKERLDQLIGALQIPAYSESKEDNKEQIAKIDRMNAIALKKIVEITPEKFKPFVSFIDMIVPPRTTRATAYLQRGGDLFGEPACAGITLEVVDSGELSNSMIRTIWQKGVPPQIDQSEGWFAGQYKKLLRPSMRWLILLFWEQKLFASYKKEARNKGKDEFISYLYYLFGALYCASAQEFKEYQIFFARFSLEYFRKASQLHKHWYKPYNGLGFVYYILTQEDLLAERRERLVKAGSRLFCKALTCVEEEETDDSIPNQYKKEIIMDLNIKKALIKICSKEAEIVEESKAIIRKLRDNNGLLIYATNYNIEPEARSKSLYNLACWYMRAYKNGLAFRNENAKEQAMFYLACSLARSDRYWSSSEEDLDIRIAINESDLKQLKDNLRRSIKTNSLRTLRDEKFKKEIQKCLQELYR